MQNERRFQVDFCRHPPPITFHASTHINVPIGHSLLACPTYRLPRTILDLPNEIMLEIVYWLPGDYHTMSSFSCSCRAFHDAFVANQTQIAWNIGIRQRGIMSILLQHTSNLLYGGHTWKWLGEAYRRTQKIELLLDIFEHLDAASEPELWRGVCLEHGEHHRRYLKTVFLAAELCSLQRDWERHQYLQTTAPALVTEFASHVLTCSVFLFTKLDAFVSDWDTRMGGVDGFTRFEGVYHDPKCSLNIFLVADSFLRCGPSAVVDLFCDHYQDLQTFERAWRKGFNITSVQRAQVPVHRRGHWFISHARAVTVSRNHRRCLVGRKDTLGVFTKRLSLWMRTIIDDEAWELLMVEQNWTRPFASLKDVLWRLKMARPGFMHRQHQLDYFNSSSYPFQQ